MISKIDITSLNLPYLYTLLSILIFAGLLLIGKRRRTMMAQERFREMARERGVEPSAFSLLESMENLTANQVEELFRSEEVFDLMVEDHLRKIYGEGRDPRDASKEFAWLKRELGLGKRRGSPGLLTRVILKTESGENATSGILVERSPERFVVVVDGLPRAIRQGRRLEFLFVDEDKMSSSLVDVVAAEKSGEYGLVTLSPPAEQAFKKREHFRVSTRIPTTILIRSDEAAFMPDDEEEDFSIRPGELVNLSGGGGRILSSFPIHNGDRIFLSFQLQPEEEPLSTEGQVVWSSKEEPGRWTAGFRFCNMEPSHNRNLIQFLFRCQADLVKQSQA